MTSVLANLTTPTGSRPPRTPEIVRTPYTVVVDTREQRGFTFLAPIRVAALRKSFIIATTRGTLSTGDYSILTLESEIAVERKSLADLFSTLGQGRDRFTRELARLSTFRSASVVVEAEWSTIFNAPPPRSKLSPRTVFMSVVSWRNRYPNIGWWFLPSRDVAEACTIRILDDYWRKRNAGSLPAPAVDCASGDELSGDELASFDEVE
jgi:hypothetical protein